jgi:hypothetical protein
MRNLIINEESRKKIVILPILFLFLFSISLSFVSAVDVVVNTGVGVGIAIEHPISEPIAVNQTHKFHFHIFNMTDGKPILANKLTTNCTFHLYNPEGSHILKVNNIVSGDDIYDYEQIVTGGNFSYPGIYSYVFQCNSSTIGGFYTKSIEVTPQGNSGGTDTSNYFWILIILTWGVAFIGFFGKNVWVTVFGGMGMVIFGIYTLTQGIIIYENWVTLAISYFSMGLGAFFMIYSLVEYIEDMGDFN